MKRKIYVMCPSTRHPSGGIKQMFSLVDRLNELGYDAMLIRKSRRKPIKWFSYNTPIVYFPYLYFLLKHIVIKSKELSNWKVRLSRLFMMNRKLPAIDSIIIFPEIYGPKIGTLLPNHKYVIFNQNCFLTYNLFTESTNSIDPYCDSRLLGCITVSEDSRKYLDFIYPDINVHRLRLGLKDIFAPGIKKKQIAFMPRKLAEDSNQVINIINRRGLLHDWEFIKIDGKSEEKVSEILKESAIFLSFNYQEGLGLPPLEAMASGCYVIGYAGQAGLEYLKEEFSSLIAEGDIISYVKEIERIALIYNDFPTEIAARGLEAAKYVGAVYTVNNERSDISYAFTQILMKV